MDKKDCVFLKKSTTIHYVGSSEEINDFCGFFEKACKDVSIECNGKKRKCDHCKSYNTKFITTRTPCFDEIGNEFKCLDCKKKFYRWF